MKIQEKNGLVFIKYFIMQKFMSQNEMKCISHTNILFEWSQYNIDPNLRHTQVHQLPLCWLWPRHLTSLEQRLAVRVISICIVLHCTRTF